MEFNPAMLLPAEDLNLDIEKILTALNEVPQIIVMFQNKPQFMITQLESPSISGNTGSGFTAVYKPPVVPNKENKVGQVVQNAFRSWSVHDLFSDQILECLCSSAYCSKAFSLPYPALKRYNEKESFDVQKRDANGYNRYYNYTLHFKGDLYLLCSQWTERNRGPFLQWASKMEFPLEGNL